MPCRRAARRASGSYRRHSHVVTHCTDLFDCELVQQTLQIQSVIFGTERAVWSVTVTESAQAGAITRKSLASSVHDRLLRVCA
jgi:hypothetical protein